MPAATTPRLDRRQLAAGLDELAALVRRLAPAGDLSLTAAATLRSLCDDGPRPVTVLAEQQGVTQPSMTQLVSRLEREGLVRRERHAGDARVVVVHATAAGRARLARRRAARHERLSALIDRLPAGDEAAIAAALPALERLTALASPGAD